jgi:hypothetical protein
MSPKNGAGPAHCDNSGEARKVGSGKDRPFSPRPQKIQTQPVRAALVGDDTCTTAGFTAHSPAPILKLCRLLADAGHNPDRALEAWRGATLCLKIRSIGEAAQLALNSKGTSFVRCRQAVRIAPPASLLLQSRRRGTA